MMSLVTALLADLGTNLIIQVLGLLALLRVLRSAFGIVNFFRPGKNLRKCYGEWAIVTGATDGIGKAYAFELARQGLNIVLISRTQSKLDDVEKELKAARPNIEVATLSIDFSNFNEAARAKVKRAVEGMAVGVLVNNVGMSYAHPQYFTELPEADVASLLSLNVDSTTWMTYLVLPGMEERKTGAVVNISSASACNASPLLSEYAAAKGFAINFTESLAVEYASKGIDFQCQTPLYVHTKLSKMRPSFTTPTPEKYARAAVARIGHGTVCSPYWNHALQLWLLDVLPTFMVHYIVNSMHHSIRKRALKKKEREAKAK